MKNKSFKLVWIIIAIIVVIIIGVLLYIQINNNNLNPKEQSCINSGGKITNFDCYCSGAEDFYNNCLVGACSCPPGEFKKNVRSCVCGSGKCFDGNKCVTISLAG